MQKEVYEVKVGAYQCQRCHHVWVPRYEPKPTRCPKCKSGRWDKPLTWQVERRQRAIRERRIE